MSGSAGYRPGSNNPRSRRESDKQTSAQRTEGSPRSGPRDAAEAAPRPARRPPRVDRGSRSWDLPPPGFTVDHREHGGIVEPRDDEMGRAQRIGRAVLMRD